MVLHCLRSWFWFIPDVGTVFYGGPGPRWSGFICSRFWFYDLASINHGSCSGSILHYSLVSSCFMPLIILLQVLILSLYYHAWTHELLVTSFIAHASYPGFILHLSCFMPFIHFDPDFGLILHYKSSISVLLHILVSSYMH